MQIREIMNQPAVTCRRTDMLSIPARLMWEHDCGAIPVVDDDEKLVGIVTDRDICMAGYTRGRPLHDIPVFETMAKEVFCCRATDNLDVAERLLTDKQVRRLPIVDGDNHPVGVLSLNDIVRYAATSHKKNGLERSVVEMLAAVGQPRAQKAEAVATPPSRPRTPRETRTPPSML